MSERDVLRSRRMGKPSMTMRYVAAAMVALMLLASSARAEEQFVTVGYADYDSNVLAINAGGTVVGYSYDGRGNFFGFESTPDGTLTGIDVANETIPVAIDDAGDIAGYYFDSRKSVPGHGFFMTPDGPVTKFDP